MNPEMEKPSMMSSSADVDSFLFLLGGRGREEEEGGFVRSSPSESEEKRKTDPLTWLLLLTPLLFFTRSRSDRDFLFLRIPLDLETSISQDPHDRKGSAKLFPLIHLCFPRLSSSSDNPSTSESTKYSNPKPSVDVPRKKLPSKDRNYPRSRGSSVTFYVMWRSTRSSWFKTTIHKPIPHCTLSSSCKRHQGPTPDKIQTSQLEKKDDHPTHPSWANGTQKATAWLSFNGPISSFTCSMSTLPTLVPGSQKDKEHTFETRSLHSITTGECITVSRRPPWPNTLSVKYQTCHINTASIYYSKQDNISALSGRPAQPSVSLFCISIGLFYTR